MSHIAKITAAQGADEVLDRMVKAVNDGFTGGKVTKHELTSWIITNFEENYFQSCIAKIREDYFNQVAYLESVLKQLRMNGDQKVDMAEILAPILNCTSAPRQRKAKNTSKKEETPKENSGLSGSPKGILG